VYYEGPEPPKRIKAIVVDFANSFPNATRDEWVKFSSELAEEFYTSGYMRGLEWSERDLDRRDPQLPPEVLAEAEGHSWEWGRVGIVYDNSNEVEEETTGVVSDIERQEEEHRERYLREKANRK
jgi:hypothetical protein